MKKREIFKTLRSHRLLAEKRNPMYSQNKAAKFIIAFGSLFVLCYLIFFAIILSLAANESKNTTALELMMGILPFILLVDFGIRWLVQQTPSQIIKPYILLPLPRNICIDSFIFRSIFNWGNTTWYAILIPYCIMSVVFAYGLNACLLLVFCYTLFIFANSQWYAIVRSLVVKNPIWWALPLGVYAVIFLPLYIYGVPDAKSFGKLFDIYAYLGTMLDNGNMLPVILSIATLTILTAINRKVQYANVMAELGRTCQTAKPKNVSEFGFLDKYGEYGEYLKLEIKSMLRNKNLRKSFITASSAVVVITLICSFSKVYDSAAMTNFWCLYCLVVYAAMMLVKIMCHEGNYIEALMIHKENILSLLCAKYIFFCCLLIVPVVLLLPTVITGKWSVFMILSYSLFTAGFQHFFIFQMAVYNNTCIPLNTKFTSKNGLENNYFQVVASLGIFIIPMFVVSSLSALFEPDVTYAIMGTIGLAFILTHKLWLRNIYKRMMKRRYRNLESFRSSR